MKWKLKAKLPIGNYIQIFSEPKLKKMKLAQFNSCVYQKGFCFDVAVIEGEKFGVSVQSRGLLDSEYDFFEEFLDDLISKNPLSFTYNYMEVDPNYSKLIKLKFEESYWYAFDWLAKSILLSKGNRTRLDQNEPLGEYAKKSMK